MKIIKFTDSNNKLISIININEIQAIWTDKEKNKTMIGIKGGSCLECKESPEEIYQKIKEAEND